MTQVFLPLRSNAAWFTGVSTREALERRVKMYLVLYDRIVIQDGRYLCTCDQGGQGFQMFMPPGSFDTDRTKIQYYAPGGQFGVTVDEKSVMQGETMVAYEADFYPILHEANLLGVEYIELAPIDLPNELKRYATGAAEKDLSCVDLQDLLPTGRFLQEQVVGGFYIDAILAGEIAAPFGVDYHVAPIVDWKGKQCKNQLFPDTAPAIFNHWIRLGLPDFSLASWEEVHDLRESLIGRDFRRMVESVSCVVEERLFNADDVREIEQLVQQEFSQEIIRELLARRTTTGETVLNLALNFLPWGCIPSVLKDIRAFGKEQVSWVSLLALPRIERVDREAK